MIDFQRPRLEEFRRWIIRQIPCEPRHARADLEALALPALLIKYMNWRDRFVPTRARNVTTWDGFLRDPRGLPSWPSIIALIQRITSGEDMTPFLSKDIVRYDVRSKTGKDGKRRGIEWGDKDYQPTTAPRDAEWGERFFHLMDPDGHELSFARPLRSSV
jgi:hypothetical protein